MRERVRSRVHYKHLGEQTTLSRPASGTHNFSTYQRVATLIPVRPLFVPHLQPENHCSQLQQTWQRRRRLFRVTANCDGCGGTCSTANDRRAAFPTNPHGSGGGGGREKQSYPQVPTRAAQHRRKRTNIASERSNLVYLS